MDSTGPPPFDEHLLEEQDAHNYRMESFWTAEQPWNPHASMPPNALGEQFLVDPFAHGPQFQIYRSHQTVSESGTFAQDSAYGSGPTLVGSANSVFEGEPGGHIGPALLDQSPIQIDQLIGDFHIGLSELSPNQPRSQTTQVRPCAESRLHCQACKTDFKTKAQLKKHIQRHEKPHLCSYSDCNRSKLGCGFGTLNDLLRHKRSVHKEFDLNGPPIYVCTHEPCRSKRIQKRWPRADNFRSHLSRQHPDCFRTDDDLERYNYIHLEARRSDLQGVGQGIGPPEVDISQVSPFLEGELAFPDDGFPIPATQQPAVTFAASSESINSLTHSLTDIVMSDQPTGSGSSRTARFANFTTGFPNHDDFEGPFSTEDDDQLSEVPAIEDICDHPVLENGAWEATKIVPDEGSLDIDESSSELSGLDQTTEETASDVTAIDLEKYLIEAQPDDSKIIKILKSLPPQLLKIALERDEGSQAGESGKDQGHLTDMRTTKRRQASHRTTYQCLECPKAFRRPCELKKHSKRHAKPYSCTFRDCDKAFGSKNDWKRHESNQHSTMETWACNLPGCHVVRNHQEGFRNHLVVDHHLAYEPRVVEDRIERCRTGRHSDSRFWCGFCVEVVEIQEPGVNAWQRRCDHIDNHLWGKDGLSKKEMADWVFVPDGAESADAGEDAPTQTGQKRRATDVLDRPSHKKPREETLPFTW